MILGKLAKPSPVSLYAILMYESEQGVDKLIACFNGILYRKAIQPFFDLDENCSGIGERWSVAGGRWSVISNQWSVISDR